METRIDRGRVYAGRRRAARIRLEFSSWVERIATPDSHIAAIRYLQSNMADDVVKYFEIESDGSFVIDTMLLEAH